MTTSKRLAPERRAPGTLLPWEETDSSIYEQEPITRTKLGASVWLVVL